jgi:hypothetical protein
MNFMRLIYYSRDLVPKSAIKSYLYDVAGNTDLDDG